MARILFNKHDYHKADAKKIHKTKDISRQPTVKYTTKTPTFRQTKFAEFEDWAHETATEGTPLTAHTLSEEYGEMNDKYYSLAVENTEDTQHEWSRIPHFYMNFYLY